jgi:hypothetical protein
MPTGSSASRTSRAAAKWGSDQTIHHEGTKDTKKSEKVCGPLAIRWSVAFLRDLRVFVVDLLMVVE